MNGTKQSKFNKRTLALAVASCMSLAPLVAEAAGLGKLTVLSGLGQPLRAEMEIGATRDELVGMTARLAPQDAFKQAGVDFATVLLDLRFAVEKRPNGQAVVKVTSAKPINEPFLDFLVELNWPSGRLVREYTFLLDPPEIAAMQASRPVVQARVVETVRGSAAERPKAEMATARPMPAARPAVEAKPSGTGGATRVVQKGDTLRKIASETRHDGVSLEQMLVGLFRNNPDAFIAENVNRLKAGAILNVPDKVAVETVSEAEAKQIYVRHAGDWNAYRQKLATSTAAAPAKEETVAGQASAGKITAKVEEKATPAEQAKDQVKVARADAAAKALADGKAAEMAAEQVARDKALKEAQERLAVLEKNFNELQKLLELKDQKLAELQKGQAAAVPAEPLKPVEMPKAAEPEPTAPVAKVEEAGKAVEAPKAVEPPKQEPPKQEPPKPATPPPTEEPGLIDGLLEDPVPLAAGGGIVALLLAYFVAKRRRTSNASMETTAAPMPSSLGPNSVFRMTGGQSVDTGNTPPQTGEFSQTGPGTIDTDEVDPVAEADVYMAYGRDTQAEEILLEALQKDPQRTAIHAKLLEIYAARRSVKQFETLAGELYGQTGGLGADWAKVAALGLALDPNNPLYSNAGSLGSDEPAPAVESGVAMQPVAEVPGVAIGDVAESKPGDRNAGVVPSGDFERDTMLLPKATETSPRAVVEPPADEVIAEQAPEFASGAMTLDFDLGEQVAIPETASDEPAVEVVEAAEAPLPTVDKGALDFDLGGEAPLPEFRAMPTEDASAVATQVSPVSEAMDFDFDLNESGQSLLQTSEEAAPSPDFSPEGTMVMPTVDDESDQMDVGLGTWIGGEVAAAPTAEPPEQPEAPQAPEVPEAQATEDLSLDNASPLTQTVVDHLAGTDTFVGQDFPAINVEDGNPLLANTVVNPNVVDTDSLEFDVKLTDSMFLGQPMETPDFDIGSINLDLSAAPAESSASGPGASAGAPVEAPTGDSPAGPAVSDAQREEVNTKLDLAKAYEEMGDLEGARELLQEVINEGPTDLVEQARSIMGRIAG